MPGVSPMRPTSNDLETRWMSSDGSASRRKWAQATLLSEEFGKAIVSIYQDLLDYLQCMDRASWYAEVAMSAPTFVHNGQQSLESECVKGTKSNAGRTSETAIRIDRKDVSRPLCHGFRWSLSFSKLPPTP